MSEFQHDDPVSGWSCTDIPGKRFGTYVATGHYADHPTIAEIRDHFDSDSWFVTRGSLRHDIVPPRPLPIPACGDAVRVLWGLDTVSGHVLEVYGGTNMDDGMPVRPRVLVEIDAGQVTEDSATVSVLLDQVRRP